MTQYLVVEVEFDGRDATMSDHGAWESVPEARESIYTQVTELWMDQGPIDPAYQDAEIDYRTAIINQIADLVAGETINLQDMGPMFGIIALEMTGD